jgi:serine/threonine protein kinase
MRNTLTPQQDYIIHESEYGKGHYGVVKCAHNRWNGRPAAVKIVPKRDAWGVKRVAILEREIDVMRDIDHPNCIAMYGSYESKSHFYIVMEPVTGGQLLERILAKDHYSETEAANSFVQIIGAVKYLHQVGIVHRDLKPENVLYASDAPGAPLKICDFGLSIRYHPRQRLHSKCGSPVR